MNDVTLMVAKSNIDSGVTKMCTYFWNYLLGGKFACQILQIQLVFVKIESNATKWETKIGITVRQFGLIPQ